MKVIDTLGATRAHLGYPSHAAVPDSILLNALYTAIDFYRIQLSLVNQNWLTTDAYLVVDSQSNEYLIADTLGKVLKVEFYDENYPWRNGPEIRIVHLQDSDLVQYADDEWWWSTASLPTDGYTEGAYIASAIAFYGNPLKARIIPRPTQQVQYRIWHDQLVVNTPAFNQKPGLMDAFHRMLPLKMAESALPSCKYDPATTQAYMATIDKQLMKWEALFDKYLKNSTRPQTGMRRAFIPGQHRRR